MNLRYSRSGLSVWLILTVVCGVPLRAEEPAGYYDDAAGKTGAGLRSALHQIVGGQVVIPYSSSGFDVHDAIDVLDESPQDSSLVRLMYATATATKLSWPDYNREHVWPQSLGATEGTPAHTDLHHIYACDANVNSTRGNKPFGQCEGSCKSHVESPDARYNSSVWEAPAYARGDIARALLYMDVRYEGDNGEADLVLIEGTPTTGCNCMGKLSTLLEWHRLDPVDELEVQRNEDAFALQGNRNPFVDHPEWVCQVWERSDCPVELPPPPAPWISELHYDNDGADANEGLELAGPAGFSLDGWRVVLYNGSGGAAYATLNLAGELPDEGAGFGARWFSVPGIQNGAPDGFALVAPDGSVASFESYEGVMIAVGGPANGLSSVDIGVLEASNSPVGHSLQRSFSATLGASAPWLEARAASPGSL